MSPRQTRQRARKGSRSGAISEWSEAEAIEILTRALSRAGARSGVTLGIGDDAAIIKPGRDPLVWTVDTAVDGVHFRLDWLPLVDIARRAFVAAASDLAAMGARPVAALSSLILPAHVGRDELQAIARGQRQASRELGCPVVGGNIARGGELSLTTTVVGRARRPVTRTGARAGDVLYLIGDVGLARAGLLWLERQGPEAKRPRAIARCCRAWRHPTAQLQAAAAVERSARAAIDVSDGLAGDAGHMARASNAMLVISESALRAALRRELRGACQLLGIDVLETALDGGEDYALLVAGTASKPPRGARVIGRVEAGRGVFLETKAGRVPIQGGFDHLR